jgi:hypothetical protein
MKGVNLILLLVIVSLVSVEVDARKFKPKRLTPPTPPHRLQKAGDDYQTLWITQRLDHFNFQSEPITYQQRVLISGLKDCILFLTYLKTNIGERATLKCATRVQSSSTLEMKER